jgi:hypothetical protein
LRRSYWLIEQSPGLQVAMLTQKRADLLLRIFLIGCSQSRELPSNYYRYEHGRGTLQAESKK